MSRAVLGTSALVGVTLALSGPAGAQTAVSKQVQALEQQIQQMQQELQALKAQVKESQDDAQKAQAQAAAAQTAASQATQAQAAAPTPHVTQSANNQFGLASADGHTTIELTGRYQFDAGDYVDYTKASAATTPNNLNSGINARRARIGITGKFLEDWRYTLIYDFGGSSDTTNALASGAVSSGIENGFIEYAGFKPLYIDVGYLDVPYTLDESGSSNDIMFIERASSQVIAANLAAGDYRAVFGGHWNNDRLWLGTYLTGPTSGTVHNFTVNTLNTKLGTVSATNYDGSAEQTGAVGRAAYQLVQTEDATLHVGVDAEGVFQPPHTAAGLRAITLADRPELRIDPTTLISAALSNVTGASEFGGELAGNYGPAFLQAEYFHFNVDTETTSSYQFDGGYVEAAYTFTGEHRLYNPATGAYTAINPAHPLEWTDGGFSGLGAWEIAGRYSSMNLNDNFLFNAKTGKSTGVEGGDQDVYGLGLNWYPATNIRFMLDYLHGDVAKLSTSTGKPVGQNFDAVAVRSQFTF